MSPVYLLLWLYICSLYFPPKKLEQHSLIGYFNSDFNQDIGNCGCVISSACSSEDRRSRFGSRPAVLWAQYSWHNGHEQWRLSGPGSRFPRCSCSPLVSISSSKKILSSANRVLRASWEYHRSHVTPSCPGRSQSVIRIYATIRFEPSKVNIFVKDCQRGGKDVTCMSAIVCFNITARTAILPTQEIGKPAKISPRCWSTVKFPSSSPHLCRMFGIFPLLTKQWFIY